MKGGEGVEKKTSEAQRRAVAKYDAENTKFYGLKLNINKDADIIDKFEEERRLHPKKGVQDYVKRLVRDDIGTCEK